MTQIYDILDAIRDRLRANPNVNTVSFGQLTDIDLNKTTMYPLSHVYIDEVVYNDRSVSVTIRLLCLDVVDFNKNDTDTIDNFYGNDNLIDVLNTQMQVINDVVEQVRRGTLYNSQYQLTDNPSAEPMKDRFENEVAGWGISFTIDIPNGINIC